MATILHGKITLTRRLRQNAVWQRSDYGWAWVDLLLLANDAPRTAFINGEPIALERGQLAWSKRSLEKEWRRSGEWVDRFLKFCVDQEMIAMECNGRGTIITILNFSAYNPVETVTGTVTEPDTVTGTGPGTEPDSDTGAEPERNVEPGMGNRKVEVPPTARVLPTDEEVAEYCRTFQDLRLGITEGIPAQWWTGWLASRLERLPHDWKRCLRLAFASDWMNRNSPGYAKAHGLEANLGRNGGEKNSPKNTAESPAQTLFRLDKRIRELDELVNAYEDTNPELSEKLAADLARVRAERAQVNA